MLTLANAAKLMMLRVCVVFKKVEMPTLYMMGGKERRKIEIII